MKESFPTRQMKEVKLGARENWHVPSERHERQDLHGGQQGFCTSEARMNRNQRGSSATLVQDTVISPIESCNKVSPILLPLECFPSNPHSMFQ